MYDLYSLGWHSFQQLCLTVTREILGQTVESFLDTARRWVRWRLCLAPELKAKGESGHCRRRHARELISAPSAFSLSMCSITQSLHTGVAPASKR